MELFSVAQHALQNVAECVASYRFGQMLLRQMDRVLWVLEKSARWAVPPPLDQDERPSSELVRPLPWVPFLMLLIILRVTRESISIVNLVVGKPPLHSSDVVMYLQSKRRYLRALKYQGNRAMRARQVESSRHTWLSSLTSLLQFTMCFGQRAIGENSAVTENNDEILVVRRKRVKDEDGIADGDKMDQLIERMMVDLNTDSDDDSSYTLTNAASVKDLSGTDPDSENETLTQGTPTNTPNISTSSSSPTNPDTPQKQNASVTNDATPQKSDLSPENASTPVKEQPKTEGDAITASENPDEEPISKQESPSCSQNTESENRALKAGVRSRQETKNPAQQEAENFIVHERTPQQKSPKRTQKLANGKAILCTSTGKKDHARKMYQNDH